LFIETSQPLVTTTMDWDAIATTDEYIADLDTLTNLLMNAVGNNYLAHHAQVFIKIIAHLAAIHRYYVRHFGEIKDLDLTPFLSHIQDEVGFALPLTNDIPLVELIRENKSWYGHKTTEVLYAFIADLVGSPIKLEYPRDLIFTLDSSKAFVGGAVTHNGGILPWDSSNLGRIRDGIYWAQFVYVVDVLQAQEIINITDLINLVVSVHPAGLKRFLNLRYNFWIAYEPTQNLLGYSELISDWYLIGAPYPTLDNGFTLSDTHSKLDMHNGNFLLSDVNVKEIPFWNIDVGARRYSHDTLTHVYYLGKPNVGFSRGIGNPDGTYTTVYPDNDAIVYQNVTENVGLAGYPESVLELLTERELQYAAYNLDGALDQQAGYPHGYFMPTELLSNIVVT
jgi:hypothetical protein